MTVKKTATILSRIKLKLNITTDLELAQKMGVPARRLQTWKFRDSTPYDEIIDLCVKENIDLNQVLAETPLDSGSDDCIECNAHTEEIRGAAKLCVSNYILPPKNRLDKYDLSSDQIVDALLINPHWARYVLGMSSEKLALIRVIGNNMSPWVSDGDLVIVDMMNTILVTDAPYVLRYDGSMLVIKRLVRHNDNTIVAKSDSQYCEDEIFTPDTLPTVIGRVIRRIVS